MRWLLALVLASCRNDAITFVHLLDPDAECQSIHISYASHEADSAYCVSHGQLLYCKSGTGTVPDCIVKGTVPVERSK